MSQGRMKVLDGSPDSSFGSSGLVSFPSWPYSVNMNGLGYSRSGRLTLAGTRYYQARGERAWLFAAR